MRELKFKALDKNGNWVYGLPVLEHGSGLWQMTHSNVCTPSYNNPDEGESTEYTDVDPHTISQFTGMYDSTGAEIYEGDLVTFAYQYKNRTDATEMFCVEPQMNWSIREDYLDDKLVEVSIKDGVLMFGEFDCLYHKRLLDMYMMKLIYGDEEEEVEGEFGGTTFSDYFDLEDGWDDELGDLWDYEDENGFPNPELSKFYKEAERLVRERLSITVVNNIHEK